jgi:hypothetical protein
MVLSYMAEWDYGNVDNIGVANNDGGVRTLLYWKRKDVDSLKDTINDHRVLLALYSRRTDAKPNPGPIQMFELNDKWPERTSWKTQPGMAQSPAAEFAFQPGNGWKVFDVTSLVRGQIGSKEKSHGVILRFKKEDFTAKTNNWSGYQFVSREGLGEWKDRHPCLIVVESSKEAGKAKDKDEKPDASE